MYYNSNCKQEKKCCFKVVHEICTYPSYYNEKDCDEKNNNFFVDENNFYGHTQENTNFNTQHNCNCNNYYETNKCKKEHDNNCPNNCERKSNRCCCFKRWFW